MLKQTLMWAPVLSNHAADSPAGPGAVLDPTQGPANGISRKRGANWTDSVSRPGMQALILLYVMACCISARTQSSEFTTTIVKHKHAAGAANAKTVPHTTAAPAPASSGRDVYYTISGIREVPNTKKYLPYKPSPVHTEPPVTHAPHTTLNAQVETTETFNDYEGCGPLAASIMSAAAPLGAVKGTTVGADLFRAWIAKNHGDMSLTKYPRTAVLVIKGKWDHAEHVLDMSGIGHTDADPNNFIPKLAGAKVCVVNCAGEMSEEANRALKSFVMDGGYLLTTDWALSGCLEGLFPDCATWHGAYSDPMVADGVVVSPKDDLCKGGVDVAPWKLDDKSEIVQLGGNQSVRVLVRSRKLSANDPNNLGILALTFPAGKGKVLHLVGHFNNNTDMAFVNALPDPAPQIKISLRQVLALNFVMEGLSRSQEPPTRD